MPRRWWQGYPPPHPLTYHGGPGSPGAETLPEGAHDLLLEIVGHRSEHAVGEQVGRLGQALVGEEIEAGLEVIIEIGELTRIETVKDRACLDALAGARERLPG